MSDTSLVFTLLARDKASAVFGKVSAAAATAGVAIGATLASTVAMALQKGQSDALMAAQIGAPPELAADLGKVSGKMYAKGFAESVQQGSAAVKDVWTNNLITEDASNEVIEKVTSQVLTVSKILTEETSRVSATVANMMRTGMADSAEEAMDLLTRATQQGINKNGDLLDTLNEYPTQFRKLGLEGPAALGLIAQAMKAGARDSDIAADALKEFSIRAVDGSKSTSDGFKMVGLNASKMASDIAAGGPRASAALDLTLDRLRGIEDPVKRGQAAVMLFGTQAEDLGEALYAMNLDTAVDSLGNVAGATQKAADTMGGDALSRLQSYGRSAQMWLVEKMAAAVPRIEAVVGWLERNRAVVGPLAVTLGTLATVLGVIVAIVKVYTIVQAALNVVMMANPIGLIVLAVAALVAGLIYAHTHSETFRRIVQGAWEGIKMAASAVVSWFTDTAWPFLQQVWDAIVGHVRWVKSIHDEVMHAIQGAVQWVVDWLMNTFVPTAQRVWETFTGHVRAVKDGVVWYFETMIGFVTSLPGRISSATSGMWNGIRDSFKNAVNWIIGKWNGLSFSLPGVSVPGIGQVGGFTLSTPNIPYLYKGGVIDRAGMAVVGDRGPELVHLSRGAQVTPLGGAGLGGMVHLHFSSADRWLLDAIQRLVQVKGRGDVQLTFGG